MSGKNHSIKYYHNESKYDSDKECKECEKCDDIYSTTEFLTNKDVLYVIAVVSNPARFDKRYQLFKEFCNRMEKEKQVKLIRVELQQGHRPFITNSEIRLKTDHEIWYKENLINIGVSKLPKNWKYMAWIDTDVEFQNKKWVQETIDQLQTYKVVQLFSHCVDMGIRTEAMHVHIGFMYQYCNGETWKEPRYGGTWHPGYAWAIRREAYDAIGGIMDFAILGSADTHTALSLIGLVSKSLNRDLHENYKKLWYVFQDRCEKFIKRSVGYVPGTILHHFHGDKVNRQYQDRWKILINNQYDPLVDVIKDSEGLWRLEGSKIKLRDDIIMYFRQRNEDSNVMAQDYKYVKAKWV